MEKESEWRQEVVNVGWAYGPFLLCARLVKPYGGYTHLAYKRGQLGGEVWIGAAKPSGFVPNWSLQGYVDRFPGRFEEYTGREIY